MMKITKQNALKIDQINRVIGTYFRDERLKRGLSGEELGTVLNISQQQISRYELGKSKFTVEHIFNLLNAMHIPIDDFLSCIKYYAIGQNTALPSSADVLIFKKCRDSF